jgi:hypothetical protein
VVMVLHSLQTALRAWHWVLASPTLAVDPRSALNADTISTISICTAPTSAPCKSCWATAMYPPP